MPENILLPECPLHPGCPVIGGHCSAGHQWLGATPELDQALRLGLLANDGFVTALMRMEPTSVMGACRPFLEQIGADAQLRKLAKMPSPTNGSRGPALFWERQAAGKPMPKLSVEEDASYGVASNLGAAKTLAGLRIDPQPDGSAIVRLDGREIHRIPFPDSEGDPADGRRECPLHPGCTIGKDGFCAVGEGWQDISREIQQAIRLGLLYKHPLVLEFLWSPREVIHAFFESIVKPSVREDGPHLEEQLATLRIVDESLADLYDDRAAAGRPLPRLRVSAEEAGRVQNDRVLVFGARDRSGFAVWTSEGVVEIRNHGRLVCRVLTPEEEGGGELERKLGGLGG